MSTTFESSPSLRAMDTPCVPMVASPSSEQDQAVVWIVDDDEAITAMLGRIIETLGFQPRTFHRGQDFLAGHDPSRIGCVLCDVNMPGISGLDLLRELREQSILVPTIMVTGHGSIPMCVEAMRSGAFDFVQKPFSPAQLKDLVKRAIDSDRQRQSEGQRASNIRARLASLSDDERQTLRLMLDGSMNKNIAAALDVSRRTVQYRISSLLEKMGVRSRAQLISQVTAAGGIKL